MTQKRKNKPKSAYSQIPRMEGGDAGGTLGAEHIPLEAATASNGDGDYSRQLSQATQKSDAPTTRSSASRKKSMKGLKRSFTKACTDFFLGPEDEDSDTKALCDQKWRNRSTLLHSNRIIGGTVKPALGSAETEESVFDQVDSASFSSGRTPGTGTVLDPLHRPTTARQDSRLGVRSSRSFHVPSRQISKISTTSSGRRSNRRVLRQLSRKDSVVKIAYDGLKELVAGSKTSQRKPVAHSLSFTPASVYDYGGPPEYETLKSPAADSVFSREDSVLDEVFFDTPTPSGAFIPPPFGAYADTRLPTPETSLPTIIEKSPLPSDATTYDEVDTSASAAAAAALSAKTRQLSGESAEITVPVTHDGPIPEHMRPTKGGWRVSNVQPSPAVGMATRAPDEIDGINMSRIKATIIDEAMDNSDRRELGKGFIGNLFERSYRTDRMDSNIERQIASIDDHRPFFTYWVTFVQIVVFLISVSVYGIAPIGFEESTVSGEVMTINIAVEKVVYLEQDNLWIGPRQADLIHLGAKYSPCMRRDVNVENAIRDDHEREKSTACCVRNDGAGCVQTDRAKCSSVLSEWHNWTRENPGFDDRTSGSVCGQDPQFCKNPSSQGVFTWPDDISKWPICRDTLNASQKYEHMNCGLVGRPCCTGIQGECRITTREDCEFRHGYFHEEAFVCSQVSCMDQICGMLPFLDPKIPDQFYRLWTSLFLHAGLLQLVFTVVFQFFIMRDMEKLTGWLRMCIIYVGSGIAGSLASAIFLPYHVEAGPAGSQFGVLASLVVEVIQNWYILQHPYKSFVRLLIILLISFILGLLPYIDNYAHLIGFVFGFLLSFAFLPFINFGKLDRRGKIIGIVVCLLTAIGLFALLIVLFYVSPVYSCPYCHYFNCIPFTAKFCKSMEVRIRAREEF